MVMRLFGGAMMVGLWLTVASLPLPADRTFTLPPGFVLELAAGPPLVDRPVTAAFDDHGRLYVSEVSGTNDPVQKQLKEKPHRILRLEDTDGDGRFDRRTVFADGLMLPQGTLWYDGSLYVAAPPSIWKLTDTNGDGVADQRTEWFQGKTLTHCANDLHGPYLGLDGWIYWAKGAFATQTYDRPGKPPLVTRAAHIFRAKPDGTALEPVMTGGMDNPVDVVFTPGGERIFTTTFLVHPGGGQRDGLIHALYGGVYGKHHDELDRYTRTRRDYLPVMVHLGPAAPSGLHRYESPAFGPEYSGNLFAALFNLRKVTRHRLTPSGATFTATTEDFLVCDHPDFHPTDVLEDADGSLLVIDTGGWYKLCCPSSQFHRPAALGAIYRVRRSGAAVADPRGKALAWTDVPPADLAARLADPRPAVRHRATAALAKLGSAAVPALRNLQHSENADARRQAVWCTSWMADASARETARGFLADRDPLVRQAAAHVVGLWRDREGFAGLQGLLRDQDLHVRRAAAEALGRLSHPNVVPVLLEALANASDESLEHSLTFALIDQHDPGSLTTGREHPNAKVRRGAWIAADQLGAPLDPERLLAQVQAPGVELRGTALWILGRHPEWGPKLTAWLAASLADLPGGEPAGGLVDVFAQLAKNPEVRTLIAERLTKNSSLAARRTLLSAMAQARGPELPETWIEPLLLHLGDPRVHADVLAVLRALPVNKTAAGRLQDGLLAFAQSPGCPNDVRLNVLQHLPRGLAVVSPALFANLCAPFRDEKQPALRAPAAAVLARATLSTEQLLDLCAMLDRFTPLELERVLEPFAIAKEPAVGAQLLAALRQSPARAGLRPDTLKRLGEAFGPTLRADFVALAAAIDAEVPKQQARLDQLLAELPAGDVQRGKAVFHSTKAACVSCHAVAYVGGKIGPDLTAIGKIRTERDLLEAVVFPSASFVRSYEPLTVLTVDGKLHNGVVKRESSDEIVLTLAADQEVRIPRTTIEQLQPGKTSIMPAGMAEILSRQELADLLAFLKACR